MKSFLVPCLLALALPAAAVPAFTVNGAVQFTDEAGTMTSYSNYAVVYVRRGNDIRARTTKAAGPWDKAISTISFCLDHPQQWQFDDADQTRCSVTEGACDATYTAGVLFEGLPSAKSTGEECGYDGIVHTTTVPTKDAMDATYRYCLVDGHPSSVEVELTEGGTIKGKINMNVVSFSRDFDAAALVPPVYCPNYTPIPVPVPVPVIPTATPDHERQFDPSSLMQVLLIIVASLAVLIVVSGITYFTVIRPRAERDTYTAV